MATPPSPVRDDQDQNQTLQAIASSTISSEEGLKWETWLKENYNDLVSDDNLPNARFRDSIKKRDKKFRGTAMHGLARSSTSFTFEIMEKIRSKIPLKQLVKTDKDGDLPVHSAIQSGTRVDKKKIGLFVQGDRQQIEKILCAKNDKGKTPIELAFETQHRTAVKLLFNLCVQHGVLSNLTGINFNMRNQHGVLSNLTGIKFNMRNRSDTLLHIAFRESKWSWFLDIVIDACKQVQHDIIPAMQVLDKKDYTPFHYLINCIPDDSNELDTFRAVLDLLKQNEVDINKIYTDKNRRTMLHELQRKNNTHAVSLLVKYDHKDVPDKQGTKPSQRVHHIEFEDMDKRVTSLVLSEVSDVSSAQSYSRGSTSPFHSGTPVSEEQPLRVHHIKDMDKRVASLVLSEASDASSSSAQSYSRGSTSPFHSGTQVSEGQPLVRSSDETI